MTSVKDLCGPSEPLTAPVSTRDYYPLNQKLILNKADATSSGTATFSGRREGLALYFARLVRPLWLAKVTKPG